MVKVDRRAFSLRFMRLMKLRGLKVTDVARAMGVERGPLYFWLDGTRLPKPDAAARLAEVLGCSPGWLLFGDVQPDVIAADRELSDAMIAWACTV